MDKPQKSRKPLRVMLYAMAAAMVVAFGLLWVAQGRIGFQGEGVTGEGVTPPAVIERPSQSPAASN